MADVELVIKIPEETYNFLKGGSFIVSGERNGKTILQQFCRAIYNGTPLPEHHGILKDTSKLDVLAWQGKSDEFAEGVIWAMEELDKLPTIIPATKEEKRCEACTNLNKYTGCLKHIECQREHLKYFEPKQTATKEEKKCDTCAHKDDDFDCHDFCVPYDFDHYIPTTKEGE